MLCCVWWSVCHVALLLKERRDACYPAAVDEKLQRIRLGHACTYILSWLNVGMNTRALKMLNGFLHQQRQISGALAILAGHSLFHTHFLLSPCLLSCF